MNTQNTRFKVNEFIYIPYIPYRHKGILSFVIYKITDIGLTLTDGNDLTYYHLKPVYIEKSIRGSQSLACQVVKYYTDTVDSVTEIRLLTPTEQILYACQ